MAAVDPATQPIAFVQEPREFCSFKHGRCVRGHVYKDSVLRSVFVHVLTKRTPVAPCSPLTDTLPRKALVTSVSAYSRFCLLPISCKRKHGSLWWPAALGAPPIQTTLENAYKHYIAHTCWRTGAEVVSIDCFNWQHDISLGSGLILSQPSRHELADSILLQTVY